MTRCTVERLMEPSPRGELSRNRFCAPRSAARSAGPTSGTDLEPQHHGSGGRAADRGLHRDRRCPVQVDFRPGSGLCATSPSLLPEVRSSPGRADLKRRAVARRPGPHLELRPAASAGTDKSATMFTEAARPDTARRPICEAERSVLTWSSWRIRLTNAQ